MTSFTAYTLDTAKPEAQKLLTGIQANFGFIPNLFAYMAEAPLTIEAYLALNQLVAKSSLTPAQAQTALLTVSLENDCNFCSVAHRALGKKAGVNPRTIESLLARTPIADAKDSALIELTQALVKERGWVAEPVLSRFLEAGFTHQQIFEVILVVTIKTLSNYTNHLTRPEPNPELLAML